MKKLKKIFLRLFLVFILMFAYRLISNDSWYRISEIFLGLLIFLILVNFILVRIFNFSTKVFIKDIKENYNNTKSKDGESVAIRTIQAIYFFVDKEREMPGYEGKNIFIRVFIYLVAKKSFETLLKEKFFEKPTREEEEFIKECIDLY